MKRLSLLISSFVLIAASIGWAVTNCQQFGRQAAHHQDNEMATDKHDNGAQGHDHHSESGAPTVHCPNLFGEFVLSSPVVPNYQRFALRNFISATAIGAAEIAKFHRYLSFHSPPGILTSSMPDYLLLSVLRI
jgi:hypothetical protein